MNNNQHLFDLIKQNKWDEFVIFLKKNEDIDVNIRDNLNNYLISYAIIQNQIEVVKYLINRDSKLDIIDNDGRTILYIPIKFGYNEILELLLKSNMQRVGISLVDMKDITDSIAISYAINFKK